MAEFKISRIRYTWRNNWQAATVYNKDDIVKFGGSSYVCIRKHTSDPDFYADQSYYANPSDSAPSPAWSKMTDGVFYRGDWQSSTVYGVGDIVRQGGNLYYCATGHTSQSTWDVDLSKWTTYVISSHFKGVWTAGVRYGVGDLVRWGGAVYRANTGHTASSTGTELADQQSNWDIYTQNIDPVGAWQETTAYALYDLVLYQGTVFRCTTAHTSTSTFDATNFDLEFLGSGYEGEWSSSAYYGQGSVVKYGGVLYRANVSHDASDSAHEPIQSIYQTQGTPAWAELSKGYNFVGSWSSTVSYKTGDVVRRGGNLYVALLDTVSDGSTLDYLDTSNWELLTEGQHWRGVWIEDQVYSINDVVSYKGSVYKNNLEHTSSTENFPGDNGSGFFYWDTLIQGNELIGMTKEGQLLTYGLSRTLVGDQSTLGATGVDIGRIGEVIKINGSDNVVYQVYGGTPRQFYVSPNGSDAYDYPVPTYTTYAVTTTSVLLQAATGLNPAVYSDDDGQVYVDNVAKKSLTFEIGNIYTFTSSDESMRQYPLLFSSDNPNGTSQGGSIYDGDVVYYLDGTEVSRGDYISGYLTAAERSIEITVTSNTPSTLYYFVDGEMNYGGTISVIVNQSNTGGTILKPFRTVRYALERAADNYSGHTTIHVATGLYEEVLPLYVPPRTVVLGDELRSTTIKAKEAITALAGDADYTILTLNRIKSFISNVMQGLSVTKTASNPEDPVVILGGSSGFPLTVSIDDGITKAEELIDDIISYIDFHINDTGSEPTATGSNTANTAQGVKNAIRVLLANRTFFEYEAVAYMQTNYPGYAFVADNCRRDVRKYIDAIAYDIKYGGNWKYVLAARYYRNSVLGSLTEDMFYMRDATGLRNCTLSGLRGTLNPPNVFDLYRRPTGGIYVSLDPSWGPEDNTVWINTRSPYIQGVTVLGYGSTGQKIDGNLHNGGYKSMVSNDFTQVIDDGIGAHVTNNGRAELVSVFTYYSTVGYLSESGGKIRATNGNNSYGRYGCIADGIDATETPQATTVNARNNEATVESVFIGDLATGVKVFEYSNCGQDYTSATATVVGSGTGISTTFDELRDNGIFEARIIDTSDSTPDVGGGGFVTINANAQASIDPAVTSVGLVLSATDANVENDYLGMRIFINSGTGAGQYGEITSYDESSKKITVKRESDGQPGWDHIIPGTPSVTIMDTSLNYTIQPKPVFSAPPTTVTEVEVSTSGTYNDVVYGENTETFVNVEGTAGTGSVVEDDGLTALNAKFLVTKSGRNYTAVTLSSGGAGYAVDDVVTLSGEDLGGSTPDNDITITVTTTTDDSTNSILTYTWEGKPAGGRYVAVKTGSAGGLTSRNGTTWSAVTLPASGTWTLAAGNNRFVAARRGTTAAAYSLDGVTWSSATLPGADNWDSIQYGGGVWLAVASNTNDAAYSTNNGQTWSAVTLPTVGDSTLNEWVDVAYGKNKFVIVANSNNIAAVGSYNSGTDTWTWNGNVMDVIADSSQKDWTSVAFGNNRFVAVSSTGDVSYSFDGIVWYGATLPTQDGSTAHYWKKIRYGQGVFIAVGTTGGRPIAGDNVGEVTTFAAKSYGGNIWEELTLATSAAWSAVTFGSPHDSAEDSTPGGRTGRWVAVASGNKFNTIQTGARALGRITFASGRVAQVRLWEPGSGYEKLGNTLTLVDPNNTGDPDFDLRVGDGVLPQPTFNNRGSNYNTSTTVSITGDGFADIYAVGKFVTVEGLTTYPGPGARIIINGNEADSRTLVAITELGAITDNGLSATFRISPTIDIRENVGHGTAITIRERYSQVRLTNHDFLDVGTGNFSETNYPDLYSQANYTYIEANEVYEESGGKVFYTSTDQSGNFRTGELFAVEQATGIVTISADFFDLSGLTELRLGGIRVGGTSVVIREFSTDPLFSEDSNNIVPTQRAVAAYLANRLSVGGEDLATNSFTAGNVKVGPSEITNVLNLGINFPRTMKFEGDKASVQGSILAQNMFIRSFDRGF